MIRAIRIPTSWGVIACTACGESMLTCHLPLLHEAPACELVIGGVPSAHVPASCLAFLQRSLAGEPTAPPPYQLPAVSLFHLKVWRALAGIPCGVTVSYGALAERIGHPGAARAVGQACGANPLPLWIPCHRVVAASGKVGGFSCGLAWKQHLLAKEAYFAPSR